MSEIQTPFVIAELAFTQTFYRKGEKEKRKERQNVYACVRICDKRDG